MTHEERDLLICNGYKAGDTQEELAERHGLTRARVGQILKRHGLAPSDRSRENSQLSFVRVHLKVPVREALLEECKRQDIAVSKFVSDVVERELKQLGIEITIPTTEVKVVLLPFEGE